MKTVKKGKRRKEKKVVKVYERTADCYLYFLIEKNIDPCSERHVAFFQNSYILFMVPCTVNL